MTPRPRQTRGSGRGRSPARAREELLDGFFAGVDGLRRRLERRPDDGLVKQQRLARMLTTMLRMRSLHDLAPWFAAELRDALGARGVQVWLTVPRLARWGCDGDEDPPVARRDGLGSAAAHPAELIELPLRSENVVVGRLVITGAASFDPRLLDLVRALADTLADQAQRHLEVLERDPVGPGVLVDIDALVLRVQRDAPRGVGLRHVGVAIALPTGGRTMAELVGAVRDQVSPTVSGAVRGGAAVLWIGAAARDGLERRLENLGAALGAEGRAACYVACGRAFLRPVASLERLVERTRTVRTPGPTRLEQAELEAAADET